MIPSEDPWAMLELPESAGQLSARRVDAQHPWSFYWARNIDHCLLVLRHSDNVAPGKRLPKFNGIEVFAPPVLPDTQPMLVFELQDEEHREIFHHLCLDIVGSTARMECESQAIDTAIARTWRWHHLLKGEGEGKLSLERQRGLVGELLILEQVLIPVLTPLNAILAWTGPLGSPKDFELGRLCIESKARRAASRPIVTITSEFQLDDEGIESLFLCVANVDRMSTAAGDGISLSELVRRLQDSLSDDSGAIDAYFSRLFAAGFRWEDDYSDSRWVEGQRAVYRVASLFPRISSAHLQPGISHVKYNLDLNSCEAHKVTDVDIHQALQGAEDANQS